MMDAGMVTLCTLENIAEDGDMPAEKLVKGSEWQFEERIVGYGRQYEARSVNMRVDMLIRTWRCPARIGMYALLTDYEGQENEAGDQYRIDNVQQLTNDDGLKVTDLTLYRVDKLYEVLDGEP